jgi:putative hemolysin
MQILLSVILSLAALAHAQSNNNYSTNFCVSQGGTVERYQIFNQDPSSQGSFAIGFPMQVCSFPNEAKTNYYEVELNTLASKTPTLAGLAFTARVPPNIPATCSNPAACYCAQVGGTVAADTMSYGWWPLNTSQPDYGESDYCVFPDRSVIDEWTLTFHAARNDSANHITFASGWQRTAPRRVATERSSSFERKEAKIEPANDTNIKCKANVYKPVCGSNGQSYDNICLSKAAGVDVAYQGRCSDPAR